MADNDRQVNSQFDGQQDGLGTPTYVPPLKLPFFKPWIPRPAAGAADAMPTPPLLQESCGFKLIMGTVGGTAWRGI